MKLAVLSGKGGAGKTFVSVNLAAAAESARYLDCDVEEPNGHLFFKPKHRKEKPVSVLIPQVDPALCTGCKKCVEFCRFNALALVKNKLRVFDTVCHSCGGCALICPEHALTERKRPIGRVLRGVSEKVQVQTGMLDPGEESGIPIIRELLDDQRPPISPVTVIDCPPGSACSVMESIRDADYCILVTEPTVFGAYNLQMVYELTQVFHKAAGAVLNKCMEGTDPSEQFCREHGIPILERIPFDREISRIHSAGEILVREDPSWKKRFSGILKTVRKEVQSCASF